MAHHQQDGRRQAVSGRRLCRVEAVPEGGGCGFRFGSGPDLESLFVVKQGGALYAYVSSCPQIGTPLNFLPDRFFDRDGKHLLCSTHGARFRVADGYCIGGPCAGKSLTPATIRIDGGEITLVA
jgi:nitrite reductase/ring-hydroxylating ferredoxin subunit